MIKKKVNNRLRNYCMETTCVCVCVCVCVYFSLKKATIGHIIIINLFASC